MNLSDDLIFRIMMEQACPEHESERAEPCVAFTDGVAIAIAPICKQRVRLWGKHRRNMEDNPDKQSADRCDKCDRRKVWKLELIPYGKVGQVHEREVCEKHLRMYRRNRNVEIERKEFLL